MCGIDYHCFFIYSCKLESLKKSFLPRICFYFFFSKKNTKKQNKYSNAQDYSSLSTNRKNIACGQNLYPYSPEVNVVFLHVPQIQTIFVILYIPPPPQIVCVCLFSSFYAFVSLSEIKIIVPLFPKIMTSKMCINCTQPNRQCAERENVDEIKIDTSTPLVHVLGYIL